jgi:hypothetical protein
MGGQEAVTYPERLGGAISYLEAVAVGLRQCRHGELGVRLEEIARNIQSIARGARIAEAGMELPDNLSPHYDKLPRICDDDLGDTHL